MLRIYYHEDCLEHDTGPGHPESAARQQVIFNTLQHSRLLGEHEFQPAPLGDDEQVLLAHSAAHLQLVKAKLPQQGRASLDPDTILSPHSLRAALRGVGAACAGIDALLAEDCDHVFCLTRPPGHHATRDRAMGFCLFNHIAIAALHAARRGVERIAIVDFDVHHGNGTQDILRGVAGMHYFSTHQSPHYPGSGDKSENLDGNITNFPLYSGFGEPAYRKLFEEELLPQLHAQEPQLLLVSAGFDAHERDPLAGLNLNEDSYRWLGGQLRDIARRYCGGRMLSVLEGGYNLEVLGSSVEAYLAGAG